MNIAKAHQISSNLLQKSGIENPELESELLIRYVLSITRTEFYISKMNIMHNLKNKKTLKFSFRICLK